MMIQKCIRALSIVLVLVYASSFFSNRQNSLFISFSSLSSFLSSSSCLLLLLLPLRKVFNIVSFCRRTVHRRRDLFSSISSSNDNKRWRSQHRRKQTSSVERVERVIRAKAVASTDGKFRTDRGEPKSVSLSRRWRVVGQLV